MLKVKPEPKAEKSTEKPTGRKAIEGVLAAHRRAADAAGTEWKAAVCEKITEGRKAGRGLTIGRMVQLSQMSRASFYRCPWVAAPGADPDMNLRDAMQRIAWEFSSYGRPRITAELKRRGWEVNHRRVHRILREDNLRLDEFPAGYSLAGWSPPEPASASPAGADSDVQSYRRSSVFHRTATSVLTGCLTPGDKRKPNLRQLMSTPA